MPSTILIVDDEPDLVDSYARMLARSGHSCLPAFDGEQAMAIFDRLHPDLVVTDLNLPSASGIEVIRHAHQVSPRTPIIAITGHSAACMIGAAEAAGASVCLQKPVRLAELDAMVRKALRG
ncbi:MAG: response regulator [Candidatus Binataceae bacterium]